MRLRSRAVGPEPSAEASAPSRTHDTPDGAELLAFGATSEATPEDGVATMGALGTAAAAADVNPDDVGVPLRDMRRSASRLNHCLMVRTCVPRVGLWLPAVRL